MHRKAISHPWVSPVKPMERVHIDFASPFYGKTFLILVNAFSKWPEVIAIEKCNGKTQ